VSSRTPLHGGPLLAAAWIGYDAAPEEEPCGIGRMGRTTEETTR
jgi:hypothetical protein